MGETKKTFRAPARKDPVGTPQEAGAGLAKHVAVRAPGTTLDLRDGMFGASFFNPTGSSWGDAFRTAQDHKVLQILTKQRVKKLVRNIGPEASSADHNQAQVLDALMLHRFRSNLESIDTSSNKGLRKYFHMQLGFLTSLEAESKEFVDLRPQAGRIASALRDLVASRGHEASLELAGECAHRLLVRHMPYRVAFGSTETAPALTRKLCAELWSSSGLARYLAHNFPLKQAAN